MLVTIPDTYYLTGMSPELHVRQYIDELALPNLDRFARAFHAEYDAPLVVTEAARSRPRQDWLWDNRIRLGIAVAYPYTSNHDEVTRGNAVDFGSGIATLGTVRQKWAAANGPKYGVRPTGLTFRVNGKAKPEAWHYDIDKTGTASSSTPINLKDWFDMATREDLEAVVRAELGLLAPTNTGVVQIAASLASYREEFKAYRDLTLWALADPTAGLRKMVSDLAKLAGATSTAAGTPAQSDAAALLAGITAQFDALEKKLDEGLGVVNANIDDQPTHFQVTPTA